MDSQSKSGNGGCVVVPLIFLVLLLLFAEAKWYSIIEYHTATVIDLDYRAMMWRAVVEYEEDFHTIALEDEEYRQISIGDTVEVGETVGRLTRIPYDHVVSEFEE